MMAVRAQTNIDKLKVCYIQPSGLFDELKEAFRISGNTLDYVEFQLQLDHSNLNNEGEITDMTVSVYYYMDGKNRRLGEFDFSISGKYKGYCFFTFDNEAFYTLFEWCNGEKYNVIGLSEYISEQLGLKFNNITLVEVCLDTNRNLIVNLRKYIKDFDGYEMFLNGNIVRDHDRKLDNYGEYYSRSRRRMNRQPTIYLSQKKRDGLVLRIYNKTAELKEASTEKEYISEWLNFGKQPIFRAEIVIHNTDLQEFCNLTGHEKEELIYLLTCPEWRNQLWAHSAKRIIYFRNRKDGTEVELADMLSV